MCKWDIFLDLCMDLELYNRSVYYLSKCKKSKYQSNTNINWLNSIIDSLFKKLKNIKLFNLMNK